jgi:hypothetical protein
MMPLNWHLKFFLNRLNEIYVRYSPLETNQSI